MMECTVVSGRINPDWNCLQANHMSTSSKTNNLICSFQTLDDNSIGVQSKLYLQGCSSALGSLAYRGLPPNSAAVATSPDYGLILYDATLSCQILLHRSSDLHSR
jgi:hypothetical protein